MTAHGLIEQIFARPQQGVASNLRWITERQFGWLKDLIGEDPEQAPIRNGMNGGLVWEAAGNWKYVLSHLPPDRWSLTRLARVRTAQGATLF